MNNIALYAQLVSEPELRHTPEGLACLSAIASFSATQAEEADYQIRVLAFGTLADDASKTFHHGDALLIEGRLQAETRNKPDGTKEKVTELIARRLHPVAAPSATTAADTTPTTPAAATGRADRASSPGREATTSSKTTTGSKTTQKPTTTPTGNTASRQQTSAGKTRPTPPPTPLPPADDDTDVPF